MKKSKTIAFILAFCVMLLPVISGIIAIPAFALDLDALGAYFGIGGTAGNEPTSYSNTEARASSGVVSIVNSLLGGALDGLTSGQINEILSNFDLNSLLSGDTDIINEILAYIESFGTPSTSRTVPSSIYTVPSTQIVTQVVTVPSYTYVYITDSSTPSASYNYSSIVTVPVTTTAAAETTTATETTTGAEETTTIPYIPPEQIYTEPLSTGLYNFDETVEEEEEDSGVSAKTIVGIVIIGISAVAVVGVAVAFKKTRV